MFRIVLISVSITMLASVCLSAELNLRALWNANTEPDMKEYRLYRVDIPRQQIGVIPHPVTEFRFTVVVPDRSEGVLRFVLTAVDRFGNESLDSNEATYPFDFAPPAAPGGFNVMGR